MKVDGSTIQEKSKYGQKAYDYCTNNWCVDDPDESIFGYLPETDFYDFDGCTNEYNDEADKRAQNPTPECFTACETEKDFDGNYQCRVECGEGKNSSPLLCS